MPRLLKRCWRTVVLISMALVSLSAVALAQTGREWISFDGSPEGTAPEVMFESTASDASNSFFDVFFHGMYVENFTGPDNRTYRKITFPPQSMDQAAIGVADQPGNPELPVVRVNLAVATGSPYVFMGGQSSFDAITIPSFGLVSPEFIPERDADSTGRAAQFALNDTIYTSNRDWPTTDGTSVAQTSPLEGAIMGGAVLVYPFHWNPATGNLRVYRHARYQYMHPGTPQNSHVLTKHRIRLAEQKFLNWGAVQQNFPPNLVSYDGDFLFIYPQSYSNALRPLINQKKTRGYHVTELMTESIGTSCNSFRNAIKDWYNATPRWSDHYCLLVGDVGAIPLCTSPIRNTDYPAGFGTDDLYASPIGDDLIEEVYLGRLSVDTEADCANQVTKILAYEDAPQDCCYDKVLLVAHKEGAPGKYQGAQESVRTFAYAVLPTFFTRYGSVAATTNAAVSGDINDGLGLVAYRGHGSTTGWSSWDQANQSYNFVSVGGLTNSPRAPVLWSFACNNQDLTVEDCLGEFWMARPAHNGAVSHYGSTVASYTDQNHELDRRMFRAVYHLGLTTESQAIEYAEAEMASNVGPDNAWMYLLLGDPDLRIRRRNPARPVTLKPSRVGICVQCFLDVKVHAADGGPLVGALVGVWKPVMQGPGLRAQGTQDEVLDNRYTDSNGEAQIPVSPQTEGQLYISVQYGEDAVLDSIPVVPATDVSGGPGSIGLRALPSVMRSSTLLLFGRTPTARGKVRIYDVSGRVVRTIAVDPGVGSVRWDGTDNAGSRVGSGLYVARLSLGGVTDATRVAVVR